MTSGRGGWSLLIWIGVTCFVSGAVSVGFTGLFLLLGENARRRLVPLLVSYATGALLGAALLGLMPEVFERIPAPNALATLLAGLVLFFAFEQLLVWRHCHREQCEFHDASGALILVGDGVHNFLDGAVIAAAFAASVPLGIATSLAVMAHEIPQELGDFAVLLKNGYSRKQAFAFNLMSSLAALPGGLVSFAFYYRMTAVLPYVTALAASSFLYIALADLVPGFRGRRSLRDAAVQFALVLAGIATVLLFREAHHS